MQQKKSMFKSRVKHKAQLPELIFIVILVNK